MTAIRGQVIPENILRLMPAEERKLLGKAGRTIEEIAATTNVKIERELHNQIAGYLRTKDIIFRHDRMDRKTTGNVGWPDFTFAINGRACAVEAKVPGGKLRPEQEKLLEAMNAAGWFVRVVYSLSDVISFVRAVERVTCKPT